MRLFPILAAVVASLLIYVFVLDRDRATASSPETVGATSPQAQIMRVVAVHSAAQQIDSAVVVRGQTEAHRQVERRAETSGLVISEPLRKGAFVQQGQVLCQLDPGTRRSSLAEARARLAEARINANAATSLGASGFASQTRIAQTEAQIEAAQAAVALVEKDIERLTITAPFSGFLESDTAELGSLLQPGGLCATIIQLDPIMLVGFVPETEMSRLTMGAAAQAVLASGGRVAGNVVFIGRSADPATRTFRVEIRVANPDLQLRDGQTAEITIAAEGSDAHLLPQSALTLNDEGTLGVRLVTDTGQARFQAVTFLRDTPDGVILTGLPRLADVIVIGQDYVDDGVPVEAVYKDPGEPGP